MAEVADPVVKPSVGDPKFKDFLGNLLSEKKEPEVPKQYACVLHNDPTTHAHRVVIYLMEAFGLSQHRAMSIMMAVHEGARGVIAIYGKDEADTRSDNAMQMARADGFGEFTIRVEEE